MKLSLYQGPSVNGNREAAFSNIERCLKAAAALDSDVAIFPELYLSGYNIGNLVNELAEPLDGATLLGLRDLARSLNIALVTGFAESSEGKIYNSATTIDRTGEILAVYRKQQLFGEDENRLFVPGDSIPIFKLEGRTVAMLICYDIEFPEMARYCARKGVDTILVPTADMLPFTEVPTTLVRARALENGMTIAYCNYAGKEGHLTYAGLSCIVGEDGLDLARAGPKGEVLLVADLEAGRADETIKSTQLQDWRPHRPASDI